MNIILNTISQFPKNNIAVLFLSLVSVFFSINQALANDEVQSEEQLLSDFEILLPNTSVLNLPRYEKKLIEHYLDNPNNKNITLLLGYIHRVYSNRRYVSTGQKLKHVVLSQYFLRRALMLGSQPSWVSNIVRHNEKRLDVFRDLESIPADYEQRPAHQFYRDAFHFNEKNRHEALDFLLEDFVREPNNVYTSFAITALNLWVGGESDTDDPSMLYNFVLGSYFSTYTIELAQHLEENWLADPTGIEPFRLSSILGGFSLSQRRWLAILHGDEASLALMDDEHRQWREVNRAFHAFTFGIPFFEEEANFQEGKFALFDALTHCNEDPEVRTCLNRPRFTFNAMGIVLAITDFAMKDGDINTATGLLQYRHSPLETDNWPAWDLYQEAWLHRENNLTGIVDLYQNNDVSDDPLHIFIKARKWGSNTTTCQGCHQTQGRDFTQEEFDTVIQTSENLRVIGDWPIATTTWWAQINN